MTDRKEVGDCALSVSMRARKKTNSSRHVRGQEFEQLNTSSSFFQTKTINNI